MSSEIDSKKSKDSQKWDIGFFLSGVRPEHRIVSDNLRMAPLGDVGTKIYDELAKKFPDFAEFRRKAGKSGVIIASVRVMETSQAEGVSTAYKLLTHVLDGLSLVSEFPVDVAPTLIARMQGSEEASVIRWRAHAWMAIETRDSAIVKEWADYCDQILTKALPYYDRLLDGNWDDHSQLETQVLHSAHMFRLGTEARNYGIEYFCKFSAMEALVAASETVNKKANLLERIPRLFRGVRFDVKKEIEELWERRHLVVHEARTEFFDSTAYPHETLIPRLDYFTVTIFYFALDNISRAETVRDLWQLASCYDLPGSLKKGRPEQIRRIAGRNFTARIGKVAPVGLHFDKLFDTKLS